MSAKNARGRADSGLLIKETPHTIALMANEMMEDGVPRA
jgi:hypothetical protein